MLQQQAFPTTPIHTRCLHKADNATLNTQTKQRLTCLAACLLDVVCYGLFMDVAHTTHVTTCGDTRWINEVFKSLLQQ